MKQVIIYLRVNGLYKIKDMQLVDYGGDIASQSPCLFELQIKVKSSYRNCFYAMFTFLVFI